VDKPFASVSAIGYRLCQRNVCPFLKVGFFIGGLGELLFIGRHSLPQG